MPRRLRDLVVKTVVILAVTGTIFVSSLGATAYASPMKGAAGTGSSGVTPNVMEC